jgi:hypothetical protein
LFDLLYLRKHRIKSTRSKEVFMLFLQVKNGFLLSIKKIFFVHLCALALSMGSPWVAHALCGAETLATFPQSLQTVAAGEGKKSPKKEEPKGLSDPHYPVGFFTKPHFISVPAELQEHFLGNLNSGTIDFSEFSSGSLAGISRDDLTSILKQFAAISLKLRWEDRRGHVGSGKTHLKVFHRERWISTNAAGALALACVRDKQIDLLTTILSLAPDQVVAALHGSAAAGIDAKVAAMALVDLISQVTTQNARDIAYSAENIAALYIEYWADTKAETLSPALTKLVVEASRLINAGDKTFSLKQKGMLLGVMLVGTMVHARNIKAKDEHRLWVINSISNLTWAASTFLGALPIASAISASLAGGISVGVVAWAVVYNKIGVRDFAPKIKEVEGHIEFSALEIAEATHDKALVVDMLETLAWMRATIHINGFVD